MDGQRGSRTDMSEQITVYLLSDKQSKCDTQQGTPPPFLSMHSGMVCPGGCQYIIFALTQTTINHNKICICRHQMATFLLIYCNIHWLAGSISLFFFLRHGLFASLLRWWLVVGVCLRSEIEMDFLAFSSICCRPKSVRSDQ